MNTSKTNTNLPNNENKVQSSRFIERNIRFKANNVPKLVRQAMIEDQSNGTTDCFEYLIECIPTDNEYQYVKILNQIEDTVKKFKQIYSKT